MGFIVITCHFLCACSLNTPQRRDVKKQNNKPISTEANKTSQLAAYTDVQYLAPDIQVELKYASADNFLNQRLYFSIDRAYLQKDVAERLAKVQKALSQSHPGYHLLIYDALRPVSVQQKMWDALDSLPPVERAKFVSNPKNLSLHNMGAAIDLTLTDSKGKPLDMGAGFDDIRKIAYPCLEDSFLRTGELTAAQIQNRLLLRNAMRAQGFRQLPTEWWHFNAC
ncbi:MAG: M15 family metallopeptidase, partial [Sphingomonadales bacterium]